jgi:hypothetical protein
MSRGYLALTAAVPPVGHDSEWLTRSNSNQKWVFDLYKQKRTISHLAVKSQTSSHLY